MAKFPTYERRQGLGGGATASYASAGAFAAPGEAMQGLGDSIARAGSQWAAQLEKTQNSMEDTWFSRARAETAMEINRFNEEQKRAATGDAAGYQEAVKGRFAEVRQRYLSEAPSSRAQQMYDEWSFTYSSNVDSTTGAFRAESELAKRNDDFARAMLTHTQTVFSDPNTFEDVKRRVMDDLTGAKQWMTPEQEFETRSKMERELELAKAKGDIIRDPKAFLEKTGVTAAAVDPTDAHTGAAALLRRFEGYREASYWDVNADRAGYGSDTVTRADGTVERVTKETRVSRADAERDLARRIGEFEGTAIGQVGVDAWAALPAPARAALISVAYNYGSLPKSVANAVRSGDVEAVASAVEGLSANKGRRAQEAAVIRGAAGIPPSPNFSHPDFQHLEPNDFLALSEEAQSRVAASDRAARAQSEATLAGIKGSFQLGIATGDHSVTQQAILASPLKDDDKASLINSLNEKRKDEVLASEYLGKIGAGAAIDPYDAKARKGVGLAYGAMTGGASVYDDENARTVAQYVYGQSGIVPDAVRNQIRTGIFGTDPARAAVAGALAADLAALRGDAALAEQEGGKDLAEAAQAYRYATEKMGMSPEDAGQYLVDLRDPEKVAQRKAFLESDYAKKAVDDIDDGDVRALFDPGIGGLWRDPDFPSEPGRAIATEEYREMYRQSLFETGDTELAKARADLRFRRVYGVAETPAGTFIIKNAPSALLPVDDRGSHDWAKSQLLDELARGGVPASDAMLVPSPETDIARREGQDHIPFDVWYKDEAGAWQVYPGMFVPDRERRNELIEDDMMRKVDAAEKERQIRQEAEKRRKERVEEALKDETATDWMKAREIERIMELERIEADQEGRAPAETSGTEAPKAAKGDLTGMVMDEIPGKMQSGVSYQVFPTEEAARAQFSRGGLKPEQPFIIQPDPNDESNRKIYRFKKEFEGADPLNVSP